ncbi:D-alanyl-D-alanine carboxypeptidase family protein [Quadrisphaera sp. DSM 44207]|uniref:M15 family metallopeptidase n=1 Tax=Quadrisphaera sp. DSM 44207 TaxID=1881057 RepID=UPI000882BB46|nr:M15 family metallopeptidase [Quadrisphaera sp. DSM 44207]SDQ07702.1 D-alanyl-D-alanine carboxypeptidase [Quadrisphaera sp. DSM 44207]
MPSHRAAGTVDEPLVGEPAGSARLQPLTTWEEGLRARAGWAAAPARSSAGDHTTGPVLPVLGVPVVPVVPAAAGPAAPAAPAAAAAPAAPAAPAVRSGRRRADRPVDATSLLAAASAAAPPPAGAPAPSAPPAPEQAPARARRRAAGPVDATAPTASVGPRPGGRRALRAQAAAAAPEPAPDPAPAVVAAAPATAPVPAPASATAAAPGTTAPLPAVPAAAATAAVPSARPATAVRTASRTALRPAPRTAPRTAPRAAVPAPVVPSSRPVPAGSVDGVAISTVTLPPVYEAAPTERVPERAPEAAGRGGLLRRRHSGAAFSPARGRGHHRTPTRTGLPAIPQVGVAGVLGLATLVAPLVADVGAGSAEADTTSTTRTAVAPRTPVATTVALEEVSDVPAVEVAATAPLSADLELPDAAAMARARAEADQASRAAERKLLEERQAAEAAAAAAAEAERQAVAELTQGCTGVVPEGSEDAANGRLDTEELCSLWESGHMLRADAAVSLARLNLAFRAQFGEDLSLTDSYRSYAAQVAVKRSKPNLAARPGTSEHGWGLAVDLGGGVEDSDEHYDWLREHAPAYGWDNPEWARKSGSGPYEPWHWEFAEAD